MSKKIVSFLIVLLTAVAASPSFAQKSVWLGAGGGINFIQSFDQGASALKYMGVGMNVTPSVTVERPRFRYGVESRIMADLCFNEYVQQAYEFDLDYRLWLLYRCFDTDNNRWHVWAGGDVQPFVNMKLYSQLMNAAMGMTVFTNLNATGLVEYDFAPSHNSEHYLFTTYAKLSLPLLSFVNRPGFAYIGNATADPAGLGSLLNDRERLTMFIPGASTDIGLYFNMPNKNKIGVSYRWDYLTTRHRGNYRFDHAVHTFNVVFMFNLL